MKGHIWRGRISDGWCARCGQQVQGDTFTIWCRLKFPAKVLTRIRKRAQRKVTP